MTPYRERREAGHYAPKGAKKQPRESTTSDKLGGLTGRAPKKDAAKK